MYVDACFSFVMLARRTLSPEKEIDSEPTRAGSFSQFHTVGQVLGSLPAMHSSTPFAATFSGLLRKRGSPLENFLMSMAWYGKNDWKMRAFARLQSLGLSWHSAYCAQETCSSFTLAQKRGWSSAVSRRAMGKE